MGLVAAGVHLTTPLSLSPMSPTSCSGVPPPAGAGSGSGDGSAKDTPSESSEPSPTPSTAPELDASAPGSFPRPPLASPDSLGGVPAEPPPLSSMALGQQQPPPSLLHLLMSAEKCQVRLPNASAPDERWVCNPLRAQVFVWPTLLIAGALARPSGFGFVFSDVSLPEGACILAFLSSLNL